MQKTHAGGRKPAWSEGWRGSNPVCGHGPAKDGERCVVAPSITTSAPCCGATKAKTKGKTPNYNTFESVERWIWDTGSGVDVYGQEHAPADGTGLVRPASEMIFHTANGTVSAGPVYPGMLGPFSEAIAPYVLESSPLHRRSERGA